MNHVGHFEKVSYEQFAKDVKNEFGGLWSEEELLKFYDELKLPKRATGGSAGYDFYCPFPLVLDSWREIKFPTGIRAIIDEGWFLACFPRSGLGFKVALRLFNTCGVIDSDYSTASNEGHIWAKMRVEKDDVKISLDPYYAFMQGIFLPFGITDDDDATEQRVGGLGSTSS